MGDAGAWSECVGAATWMEEPLRAILSYPTPLPVQRAVIPTVSRALLSGVPMDVSLTAPTGSGKTLCYLLPALQLVTAEKKGLNDTRLRALVLVPTKALGQQVFRELAKLTRHTTISVASLCGEAESLASEAETLVRKVRRVGVARRDVGGARDSGWEGRACSDDDGDNNNNNNALLDDGTTGGDGPSRRDAFHFFSKVDALVATPLRLLQHLDSTRGFFLVDLRLLVIDEADQVLAGNFANLVVKVVERFAEEQSARQAREQAQVQAQVQASQPWQQPALEAHTLHKMLCSATLSSRISRISEVRLRNCQTFALGTDGAAVPQPQPQQEAAVRTGIALPPTLHEHLVFVEDDYRHAVLLKLVKTLLRKTAERQAARRAALLALRSAQGEEEEEGGDEDRGAVDNGSAAAPSRPETGEDLSCVHAARSYPDVDDDAGTGILVFCSSADEARVMGHLLAAAGVQRVIEFTTLTTESERRRALLQTHMTVAPTEAKGNGGGGAVGSLTASSATVPSVVVASDALMRGIDIPNIGHVVMYHPPESLSQYVHRAGRTARAMRPGHLHILLKKLGPSGTQVDGEVAAFKKLSALVARTQPQVYERHFFVFAKAPAPAAAADADAADAPSVSDRAKPQTREHRKREVVAAPAEVAYQRKRETEGAEDRGEDRATATAAERKESGRGGPSVHSPEYAEWWVAEANAFLAKSQQRLGVAWRSAWEASEGGRSRTDAGGGGKRPRSRSPAKRP